MAEIARLVRAFYSDLWEAGDEKRADAILHPKLAFRGSIGQTKHGNPGYLDYLRLVRGALDDYRCDILSLICQDTQAAAKMHFHGLHTGAFMGVAPSGRRIGWHGAAFFEARDGRLADIWVLGDTDSLRAELAHHG